MAERTLVFGRDFLGGPAASALFWHYGEQILTLLSDIFANLKLTRHETGYRFFARKVARH